MMTKTFLVADHGLFLPLAMKLAREGNRVLYHKLDWQRAFPMVTDGIIGDGIPEIECVPDLFDAVNDADCFVFPDVYHQGLQKYLRSVGKRVWGSAGGQTIETDRLFFLEKLQELGLACPDFTPVAGLTALREFLKDKEDIFIKISKWRGSFETKRFRNMDVDAGLLDNWAVRFGGLAEKLTFICFPKIDTKLEIGADTYCIDGQWPGLMLHGIEAKDESYFSAVTKREDMPEQLLPIMEAFSPYLKEQKYRCQWSMEVRVADDADYFIDATCRGGLPSTGSQCMAIDNLGEIIYEGAGGVMVEPKYNCKFTAETMVKIHGEVNSWNTIALTPELCEHLQLSGYCMIDGKPWFPPEPGVIDDEVGWLVTTGDTPTECLKLMNELADELPDGVTASVESLADVIREVEEMSRAGIKLTDVVLPPAEIVLEET